MENDKKTEVITIRTSRKTKTALEMEAKEKEWTISKLAEKILSEWAKEKLENNI